jgi:hypothetical protein
MFFSFPHFRAITRDETDQKTNPRQDAGGKQQELSLLSVLDVCGSALLLRHKGIHSVQKSSGIRRLDSESRDDTLVSLTGCFYAVLCLFVPLSICLFGFGDMKL